MRLRPCGHRAFGRGSVPPRAHHRRGRATALRLARDGWHCVLVDADASRLAQLAAAWPAEAPAPQSRAADPCDAAQIAALGADLPPLDALINNAGMSAGGRDALDAESQRLLGLNLDAPARLVQACADRLRPGARVGAQAGDPAAARMLLHTLAAEWGHQGLRINALAIDGPGVDAGTQALLAFVAGPRARFLTGQWLRAAAMPTTTIHDQQT